MKKIKSIEINKEEHQFGDEEINGYFACRICGALRKSKVNEEVKE